MGHHELTDMGHHELTDRSKWIISLWTGLLFVVVANPMAFKFVNSITQGLGLTIASGVGCPNWKGIILHGLVFALAVRGMMLLDLPGVEEYRN